jgi:hypothetical protein
MSEQQNGTQFFMEHSKVKLAELIVDRMVRDPNFSREIYSKLSKQSASTMEKIKVYETAVNNEMNQRTPDVNLIVRRRTNDLSMYKRYANCFKE